MFAVKFLQRRWNSSSTVFSLSSGYGKCGVAVIRVSGPHTQDVVYKMASLKEPKPRHAYFRNIHLPDKKWEILDKAVLLWFPGDYLIGDVSYGSYNYPFLSSRSP